MLRLQAAVPGLCAQSRLSVPQTGSSGGGVPASSAAAAAIAASSTDIAMGRACSGRSVTPALSLPSFPVRASVFHSVSLSPTPTLSLPHPSLSLSLSLPLSFLSLSLYIYIYVYLLSALISRSVSLSVARVSLSVARCPCCIISCPCCIINIGQASPRLLSPIGTSSGMHYYANMEREG